MNSDPHPPTSVDVPLSFEFEDDLPSRAPDHDLWSIEFDWDGSSDYAGFSISFLSGLGGDDPIPGWASWVDGDLLVAHVDPTGPSHEATTLTAGSPFGADGLNGRQAWLALARTLVRVVMKETE